MVVPNVWMSKGGSRLVAVPTVTGMIGKDEKRGDLLDKVAQTTGGGVVGTDRNPLWRSLRRGAGQEALGRGGPCRSMTS